MSITILVLAAGPSVAENNKLDYPSCLTEFKGLSLLEKIVNNTTNIESPKYTFAFLRSETERYHLDNIAEILVPGAAVVRVPESTQGSACTALLATSQLDPDDELLIISANELVEIDFEKVISDFRSRKLDGGALVFKSVHPRYSYVRLNSEQLIIESAQQNPISQNATAGVFWFARSRDFVAAAMNLIRKNANVDGRFYIAPTFNEMILRQARLGVFNIPNNSYTPLKSERQILNFESGSQP